jgi:hypothetical protein
MQGGAAGIWRAATSGSLAVLAALLGSGMPAAAIEFSGFDGELRGRLDTTLTVGAQLRVQERDPALIGRANTGTAASVNIDDGNLNFDRGDFTSLAATVVHELDLGWRNLGFFGRVLYFYDAAIMDLEPARNEFTEQAENRAGRAIELLDAYGSADLELAERPVRLRGGNMVLNWGESTFIPNGINVINPVDVSRLRTAGAQIRDALKPVPAANVDIGLPGGLSLEAFYQFAWRKTELEPAGTFFSTNDFISPGGRRVFLGFGAIPDFPVPPPGANPPLGTFVPRGPNDNAQGPEFGLALRWLAEALGSTEFGLYYIRHHSRLPLISARTGTLEGLLAGDYTRSARYFVEYPEDIDLFGASFNTAIGTAGPALQGEISYRIGQPLQVDDAELLYAGLSPVDPFLPAPIFGQSQLGAFGFEETIRGFRRKDVVQAQITATQLLGPQLGANQLLLVGETGATWVPGLPSRNELRFDGPGTFTSGNPVFTAAGVQPETTTDGFADAFSWGYRLLARADYLGAIGPVNLSPQIAFAHDVGGTTPLPLGNFVEGRKAITLTLAATYLSTLRGEVAYTSFFGGGDFNLLRDRDFVALSLSWSF